MLPHRPLGRSDLLVSPIALGLWPIAGITSLGVNDETSIATIQQARHSGINHFDTAYSYGFDGRSDRVLRAALDGNYAGIVLASKVGMHYDDQGQRRLDTRPQTLRLHTCEILDRLRADHVDLLYLHCVDETTPIESSAECLADLQREGLTRYVGVSNVTLEQLRRFTEVIQPVAVQMPLNMLQQESYRALNSELSNGHLSYVAYWALMKGLLAGAMQRDHQLDVHDRRRTYAIYQQPAWDRCQDLLDVLRLIASETGWSVAQLVIAWTLAQPGVGSVLCGAKTPAQIAETAHAMSQPLPIELCQRIEAALAQHAA